MSIRRFFRGVFREDSSLETKLYWFAASSSIFIELIGIVIDLMNGLGAAMTMVNVAAVAVTVITMIISWRTEKASLCYVILCFVLNLAVIPTSFFYGGGFYSGMPCYMLLGLVMCAVNPDIRKRILTVGCSLAGYVVLYTVTRKYPELVTELPETAMIRDQIIAVFVTAVTISFLLFIFRGDLRRIHNMNIREYGARKRMRLELLESQADNIEEAKRQRSEMRRHNMIITDYAEKGDFDGLIRYLADKQAVEERYNKKAIYCMNSTINTVLGIYARQAMSKKVPMEIKTDVARELFIPEPELVSIVSNILESAINSAEQSSASERIVIMDIHTRNDQFVFSCRYPCASELKGQKGYAGQGGIGIEIVDRIVKARGGIMDFTVENGVVHCSLVINVGAEKK